MDRAARDRAAPNKQGSGARPRVPEPRFLAVGRVIGVHGVRGELKIQVLTDDPHRFRLLKLILAGPDDEAVEPVAYQVEGYRVHQKWVLLKLAGIDDRDQAGALRGLILQVPRSEAVPLEEGEYFEHQIVGLQAWTTAGEHLGEVVEILYGQANDVYIVRTAQQGEILIPAIAGVIREVDLEGGRLVVDLPEGLR